VTAFGEEVLKRYDAMERTAIDSVSDQISEFSALLADDLPEAEDVTEGSLRSSIAIEGVCGLQVRYTTSFGCVGETDRGAEFSQTETVTDIAKRPYFGL
jgi:hypothetical protein